MQSILKQEVWTRIMDRWTSAFIISGPVTGQKALLGHRICCKLALVGCRCINRLVGNLQSCNHIWGAFSPSSVKMAMLPVTRGTCPVAGNHSRRRKQGEENKRAHWHDITGYTSLWEIRNLMESLEIMRAANPLLVSGMECLA